jgi:hypothetical protein
MGPAGISIQYLLPLLFSLEQRGEVIVIRARGAIHCQDNVGDGGDQVPRPVTKLDVEAGRCEAVFGKADHANRLIDIDSVHILHLTADRRFEVKRYRRSFGSGGPQDGHQCEGNQEVEQTHRTTSAWHL